MQGIRLFKRDRMGGGWQLAIIIFSFLALLSACGSKNATSPNPPPASPPEWTWVSGSDLTYQTGTYGTLGTPSSANIPGARGGGVSWIDPQGKFWLFGGEGVDSTGAQGFLNEMWNYEPTTREWTWVSGSDIIGQPGIYGTLGMADPSNVPGARSAFVSWTDSGGMFWIFGGWGYDSAGSLNGLNDLWRFDPAAHEWIWISGSNLVGQDGSYGTQGVADPSNLPGARSSAMSWTDSHGNFWLFGGWGIDSADTSGYLNDLWKFNPANLEWTWVSGSNLIAQAGTYGTRRTADPSNVPGARGNAATWVDSGNNLWLFGGDGYDSAMNLDMLNDLWKFDGANWTWVSGNTIVEQAGTYGSQGKAASSNVPGARIGAVSWLDSSGDLWLFGGEGVDSVGYGGYLNDLWKFDGTNWTWVSGSESRYEAGVYGIKGTAAAANVPGARSSSVTWIDSLGRFWLFGGYGMTSTGYGEIFNDLWQYGK